MQKLKHYFEYQEALQKLLECLIDNNRFDDEITKYHEREFVYYTPLNTKDYPNNDDLKLENHILCQ
jgi:hypothetical protein